MLDINEIIALAHDRLADPPRLVTHVPGTCVSGANYDPFFADAIHAMKPIGRAEVTRRFIEQWPAVLQRLAAACDAHYEQEIAAALETAPPNPEFDAVRVWLDGDQVHTKPVQMTKTEEPAVVAMPNAHDFGQIIRETTGWSALTGVMPRRDPE